MSQNMINDLTDRVSALTADYFRLQAQRDAEKTASQELVRTADSLLAENKRLRAELGALAKALVAAGVHPNIVEEIKIEARNS